MRKRGVRDSYKEKKAQVAVEFVIIFAFILVILLALIAVNQDLVTSINSQLRAAKAKVTINDLSEAAQRVYQQGVGAQTKVFVSIPSGVVNTQVLNQTLLITLAGTTAERDVYGNLNFQVSGFIPSEEGNYWITVKARQGYVVIGFALVDIYPGGFATTLTPGNSTISQISLRNVIQEYVEVELTYSGDADIDVSFNPSSLILSPDESADVDVIISAFAATQPGTYSGTIQINANSTTESQIASLTVLVTVPQVAQTGQCPSLVMFPETWQAGIIGVDKLYYKQIFLCANYDSAQAASLSLTGDTTYLGFNPGISSKTATVNIGARSCNLTYVYINTSGATSGPQTAQIHANASGSDSSTITFNIGEDTQPPNVSLMYPTDDYMSLYGNLIFGYNTSDFASGIASCDLIINNTIVDTDNSVTEDIEQTFTLFGLGNGNYTWTVNCTDDSSNANEGTTTIRDLIINFTTVTVTPELVFEEDYDPQWTTEVQTIGDGLYAASLDEGPPSHANYPPPDFTEFDFPSLGIGDDYGIDTVIFTARHYENLVAGWFDVDDRHQIECYNGVEWEVIETWQWTPEDNMTWIYYVSPDLSSCISTAALANDIHIRVTYDPADDTGAIQYFDWAQVEVNISTAYYPDLWELIADDPQPLDFSSGLNTTNNSFGRAAGNDGWDWQEDTYGGGESAAMFNIDPDMDGNISDTTVASDDRLEIRIGYNAPGAIGNADDDTYNGPASSAAYGVQFNITSVLYNIISGGGKATLNFDWFADEDAGWGNGLDAGDEAWIKARLITPTATVWLGSDLDSGDNDADANNEIWFMDNPQDDSGHESIDISSYITSEGIHYFDLGIAVGDWDNNEGFGAYFDNIMIIIIK